MTFSPRKPPETKKGGARLGDLECGPNVHDICLNGAHVPRESTNQYPEFETFTTP